MATSSGSVSVAVRFRPAEHGDDVDEWVAQEGVIYATRSEFANSVFAFDQVFPREASNAFVYREVVQPMISSVVAGYDVLIFVYGASYSGKSHTMMGNDLDAGLLERSMNGIFEEIKHVC